MFDFGHIYVDDFQSNLLFEWKFYIISKEKRLKVKIIYDFNGKTVTVTRLCVSMYVEKPVAGSAFDSKLNVVG